MREREYGLCFQQTAHLGQNNRTATEDRAIEPSKIANDKLIRQRKTDGKAKKKGGHQYSLPSTK